MTLPERQADFLARCDRVTAALDNDDATDPNVKEFVCLVVAWFGIMVATQTMNVNAPAPAA